MSIKTKAKISDATLTVSLFALCVAPMVAACAFIAYATPIIQAAVRH